MNREELEKIMDDHKKWLDDVIGGSRADLRRADLRGVDLSGAKLRRADLRGADLSDAKLRRADLRDADLRAAMGNCREIKSAQFDQWFVVWTKDIMSIGCETHNIKDWWEFDDQKISEMDTCALEWWRKWKDFLKQMVERSLE